jgi:cell division protein FtsL
VQQKIEELKGKIRREQQETAALDKQMEEMKQEHAAAMQRLQGQV